MNSLIRWAAICLAAMAVNNFAQTPLYAQPATLGAPYVIAEGSQLHTQQIFGAEPGTILDEFDAAGKRLSGRIVKLHIVAADNATVDKAVAEIQKRYASALPAVTCVVGNLYSAETKLGIDAVIVFRGSPKDGQPVEEDSLGRILHPGPRVYVSGQAEKDKTDAGATIGTMISLRNSLEAVDATLKDVVQVKAFLNPIRTEKRVRAEIESFFRDFKVPVVVVEWSSELPIEIEMIAACPKSVVRTGVEYLTPPGMIASPLYARMTKMNSEQTIYIGGMVARGSDQLSSEAEVNDIFASLLEVCKQTGSDYDHLVKATYYCANDGTSKALNILRPNYYNPTRPPAASKAIVDGVGRNQRFITIDMIAAPR